MVEKLCTVKDQGGGSSWTPVSKFQQISRSRRKQNFAIQCVGKNKEFTWESNFSTKNFVIVTGQKPLWGLPGPPPSPQRVKQKHSKHFLRVNNNVSQYYIITSLCKIA